MNRLLTVLLNTC